MTAPSLPVRALLGLVAVLALALGVQNWRMRRAQRAAGAAALVADTLRAHADTSRAVALAARDSIRILGDSLHIVQRLVIQRTQTPDALDRALREDRIALAALSAEVRALSATVAASAPSIDDPAGTRRSHFDVRSAPYTVAADVTLPKPPARGNMAVQVTLDPATIALRLGCATPNPQGIRSATASATGPTWLALAIGRVEQDPALCASPALAAGRSAMPWWRRFAPHVSAGYGLTLAPDGTLRLGPQLGASVDVWRPF